MRLPDLLTPSERRLAVLLLLLALLGAAGRGLRRLDPEVAAWMEAVTVEPETAPSAPKIGPGPADTRVEGIATGEGPGAGPPDSVSGPRLEPATGRIDPNTAPAGALQGLPGIGPALARRIVEDRARNGPYRVLEDLLRVRGIGPATLERIAPGLALGGS